MNNTIDIKRLGLLMRWDLLTFRKGYTFSTLACIIAYSLYSLVGINNLKGVVMHDFDSSLVGTQKHYLSEESVFFGLLCFIVFYVMASCIFNNLRTKTYRENFLMLPASNKEKYMARLLLMVFLSLIELCIILFATDAIQLAFSYIINPGFHVSISWPVLKSIFGSTLFTRWEEQDAIFYSFFIFAHSFCTLGGTFYRKMAPLFTFLTGLVLFMVFGYAIQWMAHAGLLDFLKPYNDGHNYIFTTMLCILFLALSAFNYWASYKLFTRMQVISNKWINI